MHLQVKIALFAQCCKGIQTVFSPIVEKGFSSWSVSAIPGHHFRPTQLPNLAIWRKTTCVNQSEVMSSKSADTKVHYIAECTTCRTGKIIDKKLSQLSESYLNWEKITTLKGVYEPHFPQDKIFP